MSQALAEADRRIANIVRVGRGATVDPATATAIVDFGSFSSPPLPVSQLRAGGMQFWWMPTVGEQVIVISESGEIAQGCIAASIYAGNAPSSDAAVPQINLAGGEMIIDGTLNVTVDVNVEGNVQVGGDIHVSGDIHVGGAVHVDGAVLANGDVSAKGVSLSDHTHGGVESGPSSTGKPN